MQRMILSALMWPLGIALGVMAGPLAAQAQGLPAENWLNQPETLTYAVSVGPIGLGAATLDYQPSAKGGYILSAVVRGQVPFYKLDDGWTAAGLHRKDNAFLSESFHIMQQENKYRSDKVVTFDRARNVVSYANKLDAKDQSPGQVLTPEALRDPISALYALRALGPAVLVAPREMMVMGIKLPFAVHVAAGVPEKLKWHGEKVATQRVVMTMDDPKKPGKSDSWTIWVKPEEGLLPVKIAAKLGVGGFTALLQ